MHFNIRPFKCDICGKGFRHKQLLQRHSLVHTEDRPFICHICGATFKTRANLFNHNMIHTEDKPYECTQCDSKFTHKTSLVLHLRWHKGEKPFQCNVCNKFFSQVAHYLKFLDQLKYWFCFYSKEICKSIWGFTLGRSLLAVICVPNVSQLHHNTNCIWRYFFIIFI